MSFPGELRRVAAIARPDVAAITNVGLAHVMNFRDADDVARAKAEILDELSPGGRCPQVASECAINCDAVHWTRPGFEENALCHHLTWFRKLICTS